MNVPRQLVPICVALAVAGTTETAETPVIDFADPLAEAPDFLPVDRAFGFASGLREGDGGEEQIVVRWHMPPGYYLYRHGFGTTVGKGLTLGDLSIPPGELRTDEYFGESEVYLRSVEILVPVLRRTVETATVRFAYQGCAERGLCYPPAERQARFHFGPLRGGHERWPRVVVASGLVLLFALAWTARSMRSSRDVR